MLANFSMARASREEKAPAAGDIWQNLRVAKKPDQHDKEKLQRALQHHQSGRFGQAEPLYRKILKKLPDYFDALYLLGALLSQTGRHEEAVVLFSRAVQLQDNHDGAHYNLGSEWQDLGKLDKAAAAYRRAIAINSDFARAHACLGAVLKGQGELPEATACYERAIAIDPAQSAWRFNYGEILQTQGRIDESIAAGYDAIATDPGFLDTYFALARTLHNQQLHAESGVVIEAGLRQAGTNAKHRDRLLVLRAILAWLHGDLNQCQASLQQAAAILENSSSAKLDTALRAYSIYLSSLLKYRRNHAERYAAPAPDMLHVIGDSHGLSPADTTVELDGVCYRVKPHLVLGCKAWHLAKEGMNEFKSGFAAALDTLPDCAKLIVAVGEIDCRSNEGIFPHYKKHGGNLELSIAGMVGGFVRNVFEASRAKNIDPVFYGVAAPQTDLSHLTEDDRRIFLRIVRLFNQALQSAVFHEGARLVNVYAATATDTGISSMRHRLDDIHLTPDFLGIALKQYLV
jgi:tetratricopeptide (TPR) repeat protein